LIEKGGRFDELLLRNQQVTRSSRVAGSNRKSFLINLFQPSRSTGIGTRQQVYWDFCTPDMSISRVEIFDRPREIAHRIKSS
jgi:hypothetical protein